MSLFWNNVGKLQIFDGIEESTMRDILDSAERTGFRAGTVIMEQGDAPNGLGYIIEKWTVDVWIDMTQTTTLTDGEMFGEIALLNEEPRTATIVAKTDTIAIVLSQEILFQMIENDDNSINKEIMRRMEENLERG